LLLLSRSKAKWADRPTFSAVQPAMQRAAPEKRLGRLTQRIHVSRLALLNPVMVCGNLLRNVSLPM
jgi:hypothetical protein